MEDSDEYDEFLFESIQRYNTLQMFNLENIPQHLFRLNETSLCVSSLYERRNTSELLILQLPEKLILPAEEEGRSKGNDFKVLEGLYTDNSIYSLNCLLNTEKIITSESDTTGLKIYSFGRNKTGNKETSINAVQWTKFNFIVLQENSNIICSKSCHEPLIQIDAIVGKQVKEIKHPALELSQDCNREALCGANNIKCNNIDDNLIGVLHTSDGEVFLHDLRTSDCFVSLPKAKSKQDDEVWVLSDCDYDAKSCNYFGTLSNKKSVCVFDKRKNSILLEQMGTDTSTVGTDNMKLKFSKRETRFSISGLGSVIEVYEIDNCNIKNVFTHNGHHPSSSTKSIVTDHIWLQTVSKEFVVSVCDNKTLNCWDYNAK